MPTCIKKISNAQYARSSEFQRQNIAIYAVIAFHDSTIIVYGSTNALERRTTSSSFSFCSSTWYGLHMASYSLFGLSRLWLKKRSFWQLYSWIQMGTDMRLIYGSLDSICLRLMRLWCLEDWFMRFAQFCWFFLTFFIAILCILIQRLLRRWVWVKLSPFIRLDLRFWLGC